MKDYSAMSDEDINKLVAGHISFADKVMVGTGQIDYCNKRATTGRGVRHHTSATTRIIFPNNVTGAMPSYQVTPSRTEQH